MRTRFASLSHVAALLLLVGFTTTMPANLRADALDNWTTNQVSTSSFELSYVVFANGRYVAAGGQSDGGAILSSEDGLKWTLRADGGCCGPPSLVWGLTYGGGRFVAVGHFGGTASSTNGVVWTYGRASSVGLYGVAYGNGLYVAVGDGMFGSTVNSIFESSNGIDWLAVTKTPSEIRDVYDVAYGIGWAAVAAGGYGYVDEAWGDPPNYRVAMPATVTKISYYPRPGGRFVAPLGPGTNLESPEGVTWTQINTGLSSKLGKPTFASGLYFARAGNRLAISTNGTNWTERLNSVLPGTSEIASDGRRLVTVGSQIGGDGYAHPFAYTSDPFVSLAIMNTTPPQLVLSGIIGKSYRVEFLPTVPPGGTNTWQTLTNLILPSSPYLLADPGATNSSKRYYRSVLVP